MRATRIREEALTTDEQRAALGYAVNAARDSGAVVVKVPEGVSIEVMAEMGFHNTIEEIRPDGGVGFDWAAFDKLKGG